MARSWERAVRKNSKNVNKIRKMQGKQEIGTVAKQQDFDQFLGRNIILPCTLIALALLYALLFTGATQQTSTTMYWVTVGLYLLLGVVLFLRRPFLNIGKSFLGTRRWNRDRRFEAEQIKQITLQKGYVIIEPKTKDANWVFSRLTNRYDTAAIGERLKRFAQVNDVPLEER